MWSRDLQWFLAVIPSLSAVLLWSKNGTDKEMNWHPLKIQSSGFTTKLSLINHNMTLPNTPLSSIIWHQELSSPLQTQRWSKNCGPQSRKSLTNLANFSFTFITFLETVFFFKRAMLCGKPSVKRHHMLFTRKESWIWLKSWRKKLATIVNNG